MCILTSLKSLSGLTPAKITRLGLCLGTAVLMGFGGLMRAGDRPALLLRDPTLSSTKIAFSYAGCIWVANRDGRLPRQITTGGHESGPHFSPDGFQIAFTGNYNGNHGIYVVNATGGVPSQLTFNPADESAVGWTPDGARVLFSSARASFTLADDEVMQLFTVPAKGGFAAPVPLVRASEGSYSHDGSHIAYVPNVKWANWSRRYAWKHYRGGQTSPIWMADLADSRVEAIVPRDNSNDSNPMWIGNKIYFLSDRNGPVSLFEYDIPSKTVRQLVDNHGLDIKSASASSDAIIYEQFGTLFLLDLRTNEDRQLKIEITADLPEIKPHFVKVNPATIRSADISPNGSQAVFAAMGEILTLSAETGELRNLTRTTAVAERDPAWSPDGQTIAYLFDGSGEWALHLCDPNGLRPATTIELSKPPTYVYTPKWAPDSRKIAYTDKTLKLWYVNLATKTPVLVDSGSYADPGDIFEPAWSPDGRWLAYTKELPNHFHALFVYSIDQGINVQLSDGTSDVAHAAFDRDGKYLYFTASTNIGPANGWADMTSYERLVSRRVYAIELTQNANNPFGTLANFEDLRRRIAALSISPRNYVALTAGPPGVLFLGESPTVPVTDRDPSLPTINILRFDIKSGRIDAIVTGARSFHLSSGGESILYSKNDQWIVGPTNDVVGETRRPNQGRALKLGKLEVYVDPRAEWRHMFYQIWRDERDFFYDPNLHGVNLGSIEKLYGPFLAGLATRDDLGYLFDEMLGQLTVGHINVLRDPQLAELLKRGTKPGLLGADFSVRSGRYVFDRIFEGDLWSPEGRAPLVQSGVNVKTGDFLLEVNGRDVRPTADVYSFFAGTAGNKITITVGERPDGVDAHSFTVTPIEDERFLRYLAWIGDNQRTVDRLTHGRVAYIHLPWTLASGYAAFNRYYFSQAGKEAAIIDGRYNHGGSTPDYIINFLRCLPMGHFHLREGRDVAMPQGAIFGPKVLLVNEMTGSGGELLTWWFRRAAVGPIVGKRTWGGLVGHWTVPDDLLDGSPSPGTPDFAFYNPEGAWEVENHGISPDIEVELDPKAVREGHDPQLERAVAEVLTLLKANPPQPPSRHPSYPNYHSDSN